MENDRRIRDWKMRWLQWYPTRADILVIVVALIAVCLFVIVVVRFPLFRQATGFDPDWDCKPMLKGDPICTKKLSR